MCDSFFVLLYQLSLFSILRGLPLIIPDNRCGSSHHPQAKEATPQSTIYIWTCSSQYNCIETSIQEAWMLHRKLQEKSKLQLLHASSGLWWCGEKSYVKLGIRIETQKSFTFEVCRLRRFHALSSMISTSGLLWPELFVSWNSHSCIHW